jgi:RNA polymerase sigma-70 factor (ECF subfamily)
MTGGSRRASGREEGRDVTGVGDLADVGDRVDDTDALLILVAGGDETAFGGFYDRVAAAVHGIVLAVVRDPAQAQEVSQEVFLEAWRTAARFDPARGSAKAWLMTMARRRAVDRVRSAQAAADREVTAGTREAVRDFDVVSETVEVRLEQQQVRRCLDGLSELQRQAVTLAFYRGYTHREVSDLLAVPLGTVKTRLRDGLIRLRDCLGVV